MKLQDGRVYLSEAYINPTRLASYAYQVREIVGRKPESVLEVGIGNGLVSWMLKKLGVQVTTLDVDKSLGPDVVASVTDIPFSKSAFDVVACFEVLEHLPFALFPRGLRELFRVTSRSAVLSMPDSRPCWHLHLPKIGRRHFLLPTPLPARPHCFDGYHYWEISKRGYPLSNVQAAMNEVGFAIESTFRPWECPSRRFFILAKNAHGPRT